MVTTKDGDKTADRVTTDDWVLDRDGFVPVTKCCSVDALMYEVRVAERAVYCSVDHLHTVRRGAAIETVATSQLQVGDVMSFETPPAHEPLNGLELAAFGELYLVGYLLGDGWTVTGPDNNNYRLEFAGRDLSTVMAVMNDLGWHHTFKTVADDMGRVIYHSAEVTRRWIEWGLRQRSYDKQLPLGVENLSQQQMGALLAGLYDSDGYFRAGRTNTHGMGVKVSSWALQQQLQMWFARRDLRTPILTLLVQQKDATGWREAHRYFRPCFRWEFRPTRDFAVMADIVNRFSRKRDLVISPTRRRAVQNAGAVEWVRETEFTVPMVGLETSSHTLVASGVVIHDSSLAIIARPPATTVLLEPCIVNKRKRHCGMLLQPGEFCPVHLLKNAQSGEPKTGLIRCTGTTQRGDQCSIWLRPGSLCPIHDKRPPKADLIQCGSLTQKGKRCGIKMYPGSHCPKHPGQAQQAS